MGRQLPTLARFGPDSTAASFRNDDETKIAYFQDCARKDGSRWVPTPPPTCPTRVRARRLHNRLRPQLHCNKRRCRIDAAPAGRRLACATSEWRLSARARARRATNFGERQPPKDKHGNSRPERALSLSLHEGPHPCTESDPLHAAFVRVSPKVSNQDDGLQNATTGAVKSRSLREAHAGLFLS